MSKTIEQLAETAADEHIKKHSPMAFQKDVKIGYMYGFKAGIQSQTDEIERLREALEEIRKLSFPDKFSYTFCYKIESIATEALK